MVIALSAALAAASVTHLAACGLGKSRLRYFTKLLLMPLVAALYCALADRPAPAVLAAMFCGWVGDVFMIYKHKDAFLAAGMAAFGVGHILYVAHIGVIAAAAEPRLFTALAATLVPGAVAIVIFAGVREKLKFAEPPEAFRGMGILLIAACLVAMAFSGFSGISFN